MRLLADLHTHTVASGHAYSTVSELAHAAADRGLELIAVTDHGPSLEGAASRLHFWNLPVVPPEIAGVRVLTGVEANVADTENGLDLADKYLERLDFVAVGLHPHTGVDLSDAARATALLLRAMEHPLVVMVTHPGNGEFMVDMEAVVEAAVRRDVILELNEHSFAPSSGRRFFADRERAFALAAKEAGARVAINSDAHHHTLVGCVDAALAAAGEIGLTEEQVVNRDAASVLAFLESRAAARSAEGRS